MNLFWNIKTRYELGYVELIQLSPRFGVLLGSMILSICFIIVDILAVTKVVQGPGLPNGINPFWKLAFVFKCLTDTIVLDDFKTALDKLKQYKLETIGGMLSDSNPDDFVDMQQAQSKSFEPQLHTHGLADESEPRDWTKAENGDDIDFATALRMDSAQHRERSKLGNR